MTVLSRLILRYRTASSVRSFCTKSSENDLTRAATAAALSSALSVKNSNGRGRNVQWVFLGCPGVGKGTYAARLSNLLGVPHISTGDLVRQELSSHGPLSSQLAEIVNQGKLISKHLEESQAKGEMGFILDGFPRTVRQAEILDGVTDIDLVINLKLRKEALIAKCLGRRICSECGGNYNVASIDIKGEDGSPRMYMPPLLPPPNCESKLITRSDDTEVVVKERLLVYNEKSQPVEEFYRARGKLLEFDLPGGIPESWTKLLQALNLDDHKVKKSAAA
ncbi:probable adenylate kinase 6, chloroplastic [Olea europaea subsp. europaea]|uniref:adenylate kinase n=1 Tax=Olea europaea subsp. europaea TaxID=158383 RepID=A0A8S0PYS1_OLEEU|nr:probable adenylate kinase 6, chloroplastic [Olea europaea subsp. europaea]